MTRRNHPLTPKRSLKRIISDSFRAGFEALDDRPATERRHPADDKRNGPAEWGGELETPTAGALRS